MKPSYVKLSYDHYTFSLRERIQYSVFSLILCFLVNDLCYRNVISFFLLLPFCFLYLPFKRKQLLYEKRKRLYHQFRDALNSIDAAVSAGYSLENAVSEAKKDLMRIYGTSSEMVLELSYMESQMLLSVPVEKLFYELGKKSHVIIQKNKEQREGLEDPNLDPDDFDQIMDAKSKLIDQLNELDSGFEEVFARVKEELELHRSEYKDEIFKMQELIRMITDKSLRIQQQELQNKKLMEQKFASVRKQVREVRQSQKVVNQYYKSMMKANYQEPQFLDNKN